VDLAGARRLDDNLAEVAGGIVACAHCGHELGRASADAHLAVAVYEGPSTDAGPQVVSAPTTYVDTQVVFRQLCCPGCYTAIYSNVVPADHPHHATHLASLVPAAPEPA
jgi:N-methylhydantoinase B